MVYSIAALLITGSEPGRPRQTGQTNEFGSAPKAFGQPQNIFAVVPSSTCVSSPITGSYLVTASSNGTGRLTAVAGAPVIAPPPPSRRRPRRCPSRRRAADGRAAGRALLRPPRPPGRRGRPRGRAP